MKNVTAAEFYKDYNQLPNRIYLYGASATGQGILQILEGLGMNIEAFADKNKSKCQNGFCGYKVILPQDIPEDACVIITTSSAHIASVDKMLTEEYKIANVYYFPFESFIVKQPFFLNGYDNNQEAAYEEQYQQMIERYDSIEIYPMWADRIGEFIYRYMIMEEDVKRKSNNTCCVILPYVIGDVSYANTRLMGIISRQSQMIYQHNEGFWAYVIERHIAKLEFCNTYFHTIEAYNKMAELPWKEAMHYLQNSSPVVQFSKEEEKEAQEKMERLGIREPFVCVFARDSAYLSQRSGDFDYHDYRDYDINNFHLLADYLKEKNIQVIRVGAQQNGQLVGDNVVDITNEKYDALLDLYVNSRCSWWLGSNCGSENISALFRKKKINVNVSLIVDTFWEVPYCVEPCCRYIPKLYFSVKEERYLSLREMCLLNLSDAQPYLYEEKYQVILKENSAEDILELFRECEQKENGTWHYTEEEKALQEKYQMILNDIYKEHPDSLSGYTYTVKQSVPVLPIGSSFLKKYSDILLK